MVALSSVIPFLLVMPPRFSSRSPHKRSAASSVCVSLRGEASCGKLPRLPAVRRPPNVHLDILSRAVHRIQHQGEMGQRRALLRVRSVDIMSELLRKKLVQRRTLAWLGQSSSGYDRKESKWSRAASATTE